tara:strand:- start:2103 stop:2837 length:735 start_codon:yes stop_codon:yes gene_type:complete
MTDKKTPSIEEMYSDISAQLTEHDLAPDLGGDYAENKAAADYYTGCEDWPDEKIRLEHAKLFEYAPDPPERSPEQMKRAAKVREGIDNAPRLKAWTVEGLFEHAPDGDFSWEPDEAGDWHVYCCGEKDCPVQWHQQGYILNIRRRGGKRSVELMSCDEDGNWDYVDGWSDGEENDWFFEELANQTRDYFKGWAEYNLYVFNGGKDVLSNAPFDCGKGDDLEGWLKAAEKNVELLTGRELPAPFA